MKWKEFIKRFLWCFFVLGGWLIVLYFLFSNGCTFKIIIPNNFKTEHTFHIKMDYPAGLPTFIDTTKSTLHGYIILDTNQHPPVLINNPLEEK